MLPVVIYEPPYASRLWPVSDFYPVWELRCGAYTFVERWKNYFPDAELILLPRPDLSEVSRSMQPGLKVISRESLPDEAVFISALLLPSPSFDALSVAAGGDNPHCKRMTRGAFPEILTTTLHDNPCGSEDEDYLIIREIWHLVQFLQPALRWDISFISSTAVEKFTDEYKESNAFISNSVLLHSPIAIDTSSGPVLIAKGVEVKPFSSLVGPLYIGENSIVLGGRISHSSFGRKCRISGEVTDSVFQDLVNKAHDGFIGHSWLSACVNIGAMTTNSNLKNTYGSIRLQTPDGKVDTGLNKFGFVCGPHTKFGIGSLIPTGSLYGGFCSLAAGGEFLPKHLGSFTWLEGKQATQYKFDSAVKVAHTVCERRNEVFSSAEMKRALAIYKKIAKT